MTEKGPIYVSFNTIQQSCILCTHISLSWQKVWYRFKTFGMLHHAEQPPWHHIPEDLNMQQLHCKKLKSHKAQHSPDTRRWLVDTRVYMKCSTFLYRSVQQLITGWIVWRLNPSCFFMSCTYPSQSIHEPVCTLCDFRLPQQGRWESRRVQFSPNMYLVLTVLVKKNTFTSSKPLSQYSSQMSSKQALKLPF